MRRIEPDSTEARSTTAPRFETGQDEDSFPAGETGGFTLVEIVMALLLLSVGILGLAATTGFVVRQTELSAVTTERATVRQSVVESLQARDLPDVTGGSTTMGSFQVTWRVTETTSLYKTVEVVTTGPGLESGGGGPPRLASGVSDTYTFRLVDLRP